MQFVYRNRVGFLLAIIKLVLPFLLQHSIYELHRDEFLYLEEGNHLAWGFMEVPPLLSLFSKVTLLLGGSIFWVKFWPALFGAITLFITCSMARQMGGSLFAQFLAGLCLIIGVYLRAQFLFQINFLEIFFWTLSAYYIIRFTNTQHQKYLYFLGICLGLGFMSKFSISFFIAGILAGLLLTKYRTLFLNKNLYLAGLIALVIILPNVWWQYMHKWPVIHHMKELRETQLQFISPADFLKNQVLMHLSYFYVWIGGLYWLLFEYRAKSYRIIAWIFITIIVLLAATNGKDYYSLGAYPMLLAAGGVWLEQVTYTKHWLRYVAVGFSIIIFAPFLPFWLPIWKPAELAAYYHKIHLDKAGGTRWEDLQNHELPQDFADMISWKELGTKVSAAYANLPDSIKENTVLYCRNYALAGAVGYYGKNLPQVNSDNASYLFWMPDQYHIKNLLFVGKHIPDKDDAVFQQFESYQVLDSTTTPMAREKGVKIILYKNANDKVNQMITLGIKKMKDEYRR